MIELKKGTKLKLNGNIYGEKFENFEVSIANIENKSGKITYELHSEIYHRLFWEEPTGGFGFYMSEEDINKLDIISVSKYINEVPEDTILWAKGNDTVIIPSKRDEDSDYDIYANFEDEFMVLEAGKVTIVPTNLYVAMPPKYRLKLEERGSTGTKSMVQQAGVIDSGYRDTIGVPIYNGNNKPIVIAKKSLFTNPCAKEILEATSIIYPYEKAICQGKVDIVPDVKSEEIDKEILKAIPSQRGTGKLGSSGK